MRLAGRGPSNDISCGGRGARGGAGRAVFLARAAECLGGLPCEGHPCSLAPSARLPAARMGSALPNSPYGAAQGGGRGRRAGDEPRACWIAQPLIFQSAEAREAGGPSNRAFPVGHAPSPRQDLTGSIHTRVTRAAAGQQAAHTGHAELALQHVTATCKGDEPLQALMHETSR